MAGSGPRGQTRAGGIALWRGLGLGRGVQRANSQCFPHSRSPGTSRVGGPWEGKVAREGVAGLQAMHSQGKGNDALTCGGRLLAWCDCVGDSCDFSSGPRCMVSISPLLPLLTWDTFLLWGRSFLSSGRCTQPPGNLPVDFLTRRAPCPQIGVQCLSTSEVALYP